jgi:hypothetical protein
VKDAVGILRRVHGPRGDDYDLATALQDVGSVLAAQVRQRCCVGVLWSWCCVRVV